MIWDNLPDDILQDKIWPHMSPCVKLWTNKKDYEKYHHLVKDMIPIQSYQSYIRDMIRNDYSYVMNFVLRENFNKWILWKKYQYKSIIYNNYIIYLRCLCNETNSYKCKGLINNQMENKGIKKKKHRDIRIKNTRWTN